MRRTHHFFLFDFREKVGGINMILYIIGHTHKKKHSQNLCENHQRADFYFSGQLIKCIRGWNFLSELIQSWTVQAAPNSLKRFSESSGFLKHLRILLPKGCPQSDTPSMCWWALSQPNPQFTNTYFSQLSLRESAQETILKNLSSMIEVLVLGSFIMRAQDVCHRDMVSSWSFVLT